jgi:hypothetical protein
LTTKSRLNSDDKDLSKIIDQIEDFLIDTEDARVRSQRARDYRDGKQWTSDEAAKIESRNQAPIVINRIKPKVEGLKGLVVNRKTDPRAFARTPKHEKAAEAVTDGLRYVKDNVRFDKIKMGIADNYFIEGYAGAIVEVKTKGKEKVITTKIIPWDRYYYDTHSVRHDFEDKRYDGMVLWMDAEELKEKMDLTDEEIEELLAIDGMEDSFETFDDKPRWADRKKNRIRIARHYFIKDNKWHTAVVTKAGFLPAFKNQKKFEVTLSPYKDEDDNPVNPIEAVAANIDRDNQRCGEVDFWIDLQDEINHRRSKFLFLLSSRQTSGRKGAVKDIPALKRELAKPNGHVEFEGEKGDFEVLRTNDMAEGQFTLLQDAKNEIDSVSFNAQLSGERQGAISGVAVSNLQDAGTNEIAPLFFNLNDWEERIYRQWWWRMRQFWKKEKWVRILDDSTKLRYVGFNQGITLGAMYEEKIQDVSIPEETRMVLSQELQQISQTNPQLLQQIVEVRNELSKLEMDIMIKTAPDSINIQREQFELLANIAQTRPEVPFTEVLKLSELRGKEEIIKSIEESARASAEQNAQIQQATLQAEMAEKESKIDVNKSKAGKDRAATVKEMAQADKLASEGAQTDVQTDMLMTTPPKDTGVVI